MRAKERVNTLGILKTLIICSTLLVVGLFISSALYGQTVGKASEEEAFKVLQSGNALAIVRHALAPGIGDPPDFRIGDCSTQRNLSEKGRRQAREIGAFLREKGIFRGRVYSSQWCRCVETARLMGIGPVTEVTAFNSFFRQWDNRQEQTEKARKFIASLPGGDPVIIVTHQVNIEALTGLNVTPGEIVVFQLHKDGRVHILGRFH